jgi:hypothetical protein
MKKFSLLGFVVFAGLFSAPAWAGSFRTFVSGAVVQGSGSNGACTLQTPCNSLSQALSLTNPGGEVVVVGSGSFGPVTIGQSVTIETAPGVYAGITAPALGAGVIVNGGPGATVILRGLTIISGGGSGIVFDTGEILIVENCVINGSGSTGSSVGIANATEFGGLFVKNTVIENFFTGVLVVSSEEAEAVNSLSQVWLVGDFDDNSTGLLDIAGTATITDSVIGFFGAGIYVDDSDAEVNVEGCQIANNFFGVGVQDGGTARVSNSTVTDNFEVGLVNFSDTGTLFSLGNNTVFGFGAPTSGTITPYPLF